jgi:hypothetical protein
MKRQIKVLASFLSFVVVLSVGILSQKPIRPVFGEPSKSTNFVWKFVIGEASVTVSEPDKNDEIKILLDVPVLIKNGRTFVSLRTFAHILGMKVSCEHYKKEITYSMDKKTVKMLLDKPRAWIDNQEVVLDVSPFIIDGRIVVPLRFVFESFGWVVTWNETKQVVTCEYPGN